MKVYYIHIYKIEIMEVEIQRMTYNSVWINGKVNRNRGKYFETFEDAKKILIERENKKVEHLKSELQRARSSLGQAKSLRSKLTDNK